MARNAAGEVSFIPNSELQRSKFLYIDFIVLLALLTASKACGLTAESLYFEAFWVDLTLNNWQNTYLNVHVVAF